MKRGPFVVALVFLFLFSGILATSNHPQPAMNSEAIDGPISELNSAPRKRNSLADEPVIEGTLDPVVIEQTGNKTNPTLHAETDSKTNVQTNLTIDTANGWTGNTASVNLLNLKRLYVLNSSLTEGIEGDNNNPAGSVPFYPYGWDATSYTPDATDLIARYANQEVTVVGNGYGSPGTYFYANGSYVFWTQTVNNTPYLENFILNFDYYYSKGPDFHPNVTLRVYIDDSVVWSNSSLLTATQYNSGDILVDLTGIGSQFEFKIGLYFNGNTFHTHQFIEFTLDNIQFTGAIPPAFNDASISLNIGGESAPITGTSTGFASIVNTSLWRTENVLIELAVDLGYAFDYIATMKSSRYINSTYTTTLLEDGVHFTALRNDDPSLEFYTFVGAIPDIDDFTLIIRTPSDWENVTVYNAFGTPVTPSCIVKPGNITIPNSLLSTLGWWEVHIESPNYIHTLQTLKFDETSSTWSPDSVFRSTNITKPLIVIGDESPISDTLLNVNITWHTPDGAAWFSELVSDGTSGAINGSELVFGPVNTTAGVWLVSVMWTNGTELAIGSTSFEVHHRTTLSPHEVIIEAESGLSVSNFVYFQDSENNEFITNPTASVTANWSLSTVVFVPDPIQNRWVGTFDTSLVGPGSHLVIVNASRPYFDDASCTFIVSISFADNDLTIDNPTADIGIGDTYLATFRYSDTYDVGISDANVSIDFTGTIGGVTWSDPIDLGGGDYSVEFTAVHSGSYVITVTASKNHYEESADALFMFIGEKTTSLSLENGTSAIISFGEQYRLVVRYTNGTDHALDGANVTIFSTNPGADIAYTSSTNEGNGYYSFTLTPADIGTWTILVRASLQDHSTNLTSFTLTATAVSTQLNVAGGSNTATVGIAQQVDVWVFYVQTGGMPVNISDASIEVTFTSLETLSHDIIPQTEGYILRFEPNQTGLFEFTVTASKAGFQSDFVEFTLIVRERALQIEMDAPVWVQLSDLTFTLNLIEVDTGNPVSDATVTFRLYRLLGVEMEGYLNETSVGVYSTTIQPLWYDGSGYTVRFYVEKENYALDQEYEFIILQFTPPEILWQIMVATYGPPIAVVAVVAIVSLSGRVVYQRKKKREFATFIENQRRFDDADNIIGAIVMHKKSGIPIYSRIVKGGFEEGIVAAFISAVTTFRDEFEMLDDESMRVIPISDIIRAVQTPNLICAFITVRSASIEHNRKIEEFSRETSKYLDEFYIDSKPPSTLDPRIAEIINYVFDETMDGVLIKYHKLGTKKIPNRYEAIEKVLLDAESNHCSKPVNLARALAKYGVPEARGCTLVSEAIEKELIILCEEEEFPESDFDLHTFLNNNKKDE